MCGFFFSQKKNGSQSAKLLKHRGPDFHKTYQDDYLQIHNFRLGIVDQNSKTTHPTFSKSRNTLITFNGEVYNYLELKKKYNLKPLIISEAHVMAEFFDKFGMKKINELNGMFAFIFYNLKSRKVIFFRDRYGIKPLNYTFINNNIYVSSEIKPLLDIRNKLGIKNYQIEQDSVINFLFRARINHDQYTFFKNIHSLTPGHYLSFDLRDNKYFIKRFYFFKKRKFNNERYESQLENNIKKKIKLYSITKRKSGVLLSGGVDSSLISSLLKKSRPNISSFTYGFLGDDEKDFNLNDDIDSSKQISKELKIKNYHALITPKYIINNFDKILKIMETPFTSIRIFGIYRVYELAKSKGFSMILDGQGGDEAFGGYRHHLEFANNSYSARKMIKILDYRNENGFLKDGKKYIFKNLFSKKLLKKENEYSKTLWTKNYNNLFNKNSLLQNSQIEDIFMNTIPRSLHYVDRCSMVNGVESRLPFMDNEIVDFGIGMPDYVKSDNVQSRKIIKNILKRYLKNPVDVKKYVADPQTLWLRTYLKDFLLKDFNSLYFKNNNLFNSYEVKKAFNLFLKGNDRIPSYTFFIIFCLNRYMKLFKIKLK